MSKIKIKTLLIGLGKFGEQHLRTLLELENEINIELKVVLVKTQISKSKWSKVYNVPIKTIKEFKIEETNDIDAVIIVTPAETHFDLAKTFISKADVFIEKPITTDKKSALHLEELAVKHNKIIMPGHIFRFHPVVKSLKSITKENGAPNSIFGEFLNPLEKTTSNKNPSLEMLHLIDIVDYLFLSPIKVISNRKREQVSHISMIYQNSIYAKFSMGWKKNYKRRNLFLIYSDFWIECNLLENSIFFHKKGGQVEKQNFSLNPIALKNQLIHFFDAINDKGKNIIPNNTGSKLVDICTKGVLNIKKARPKIAVVGGGVFGASIAIELNKLGDVDLFERHSQLFNEASYYNQWRHHSGFHYPISYEIIQEIKECKSAFEKVYGDAIRRDIISYFCTSSYGKEIPAERYLSMCMATNLDYEITSPPKVLNPKSVSLCLKTDEGVYDMNYFKEIIMSNIKNCKNIDLHLNANIVNGNLLNDGRKALFFDCNGKQTEKHYDYVINATYANWHVMSSWFGFPIDPIRLELVELLVLKLPIEQICVTILDGPFNSLIGMGEKSKFLLSHRDYSVLSRKIITDGKPVEWGNYSSNRERMLNDVSRYIPSITDAEILDSWFTTKAISAYEKDFWARPTIVKDYGFGCWSVLGGKILTCISNAKEIATSIKLEIQK